MAMRLGGGYLNPGQWKCWQNPQWKRLALKLGLPGRDLLRSEPFDSLKCFHAGGAAKGWLPDFVARHRRDPVTAVTAPGGPMPFEELTRAQYDATRRLKRLAAALGYYRWFAH